MVGTYENTMALQDTCVQIYLKVVPNIGTGIRYLAVVQETNSL